ncbi:MAG: hypothetical protein EOP47_19950 [Sphingobacteriaceae bacterium]|nr:MAG: hypothetical protein EOP47_19950 [Sphingobacteriaceae bacterium]
MREFVISDNGIDVVPVYLGPDGVLTGSAREAQQIEETTGAALRDHALSRKDREISRKRKVLESKISNLQAEFESAEEELNKIYLEEELKNQIAAKTKEDITRKRSGIEDDKQSGKE